MLKKTSASIGLIIATAAGILLSGAPAQAQGNSISGCRFCHHGRNHGSNWNGNRTRPRIFIRIFIYNKNNNAAVARNGARQRSAQDQRLRREPRREPRRMADLRGRGVLAPAQLTDPARSRVVSHPAHSRTVSDPSRYQSDPANQVLPRDETAPRAIAQAPERGLTPRDNQQVSKNGVVRSGPGNNVRPRHVDANEAGQNGIQANPGTIEPNQDIRSWLDPALS